jgi:seryl-tRNA synthetase
MSTPLPDVLSDMVKRRANLAKDEKALKSDKDRAKVLHLLDELIAKVKPLADSRKKIDKVIDDYKAVAPDVKKYNADFQKAKEAGLNLSRACNDFRGKGDTPAKDFSGLWVDGQALGSSGEIEL